MPMQKGDVKSTLSDTNLLRKITGYKPKTTYQNGIKKFLNWYKLYKPKFFSSKLFFLLILILIF